MTDAISNNAANALRAATRAAEATTKARVDDESIADPAAAPTKIEPSTVELTLALKNALVEADFDANKVQEIKTALEQGNYPLDNKKIAESFVPLEKLL